MRADLKTREDALLDRIMQTGAAIRPHVSVTPLYYGLGVLKTARANVFLKAEHFWSTAGTGRSARRYNRA
jgi:hypothetical protein